MFGSSDKGLYICCVLIDKAMNDAQREEIRRLHRVCRAKDETIKDLISTATVLLNRLCLRDKLTEAEKQYYRESIKDFENEMG